MPLHEPRGGAVGTQRKENGEIRMNARKKGGKKNRRRIELPDNLITGLAVAAACLTCLRQARLAAVYGEWGSGYYSAALCCFLIPAALVLAGLYGSASSMVVNRLERGRGRDARRAVRSVFFVGVLLSALWILILYALSGFLTGNLLRVPLASMTLRVLAPSLFCLMVMTVLAGGLDGFGCQSSASFVKLLFCLVLFISGTLIARPFAEYGQKVGALLQNAQYGPAYGAVGGAVSLAFSSVLGMVCAMILWISRRAVIRERMQMSVSSQPEPLTQQMSAVLVTSLPVFLPLAFLGLAGFLQTFLYFRFTGEAGAVPAAALQEWGSYTGKSRALFLGPALLALLFAGYMQPGMKVSYLQRNPKRLRERCMISLRSMLLLTVPFAVALTVLARPFLEVLFPDSDNALALSMIRLGSLGLVLFGLTAVLGAVMLSMDMMGMFAAGMAVSLAVYAAVLYLLLSLLKMGAQGVVFADIILFLCLCAICYMCVSRQAKMRVNWIRILLAPLVGGLVMAGICALFGLVLLQKAPALLCASVSTVLGFAAYCAVVLLLKGATPRELNAFPGGETLIAVAHALRLL